MTNFKKGFTLVELMIVITVIAILSTLSLFGFRAAQASARDASRLQIMSSLRNQLERYYADNSSYPVVTAAQSFVDITTPLGYTNFSDPGCGAGAIVYNAANKNAADDWTPTPVSCTFGNQPTYQYQSQTAAGAACVTSPCPKYKLTLLKEGGGTSLFNSPN